MSKKPFTQIRQFGFSLIELLVVIAIIGILASVIMLAMNGARQDAKLTKTQADLRQLKVAIAMLAQDTGKWPNGCPTNTITNPEVLLDQPSAGIKISPIAGIIELPCEWTAEEVANWRGPYALQTQDLWGRSYRFDADYTTHCESGAPVQKYVVHSMGSNGVWGIRLTEAVIRKSLTIFIWF